MNPIRKNRPTRGLRTPLIYQRSREMASIHLRPHPSELYLYYDA